MMMFFENNNDSFTFKGTFVKQQNIINETDRQKSDLINKYSYLIGEKFKIIIPISDSNNNIYKEFLLQINIDAIEAR